MNKLVNYRPIDQEGNTYGIVLASGKRWAEQRKFFSQYLANSKDSFDDIIGDEASRLCNHVRMLPDTEERELFVTHFLRFRH